MTKLLMVLSLGLMPAVHADDGTEYLRRPFTCGDVVLKFRDDGSRVLFDGDVHEVTWSDDGADALFAGRNFHVEAGRFSLNGVPCAQLETSW